MAIAQLITPGIRALTRACEWFLKTNVRSLWHHATKATLPEWLLLGKEDGFATAAEFIGELQRLRHESLLVGEIHDHRASFHAAAAAIVRTNNTLPEAAGGAQ